MIPSNVNLKLNGNIGLYQFGVINTNGQLLDLLIIEQIHCVYPIQKHVCIVGTRIRRRLTKQKMSLCALKLQKTLNL